MTTTTASRETVVDLPSVTGSEVARELCRVFGIDTRGIRKITLEVEAGGAAVFKVEKLIRKSTLEGVTAVLDEYVLAKEVRDDE